MSSSLGETMFPNESTNHAVLRCLQEELSIYTLPRRMKFAGSDTFNRGGWRWPGLATSIKYYLYKVYLSGEQYVKDGYSEDEKQDGKIALYKWKPLNELRVGK